MESKDKPDRRPIGNKHNSIEIKRLTAILNQRSYSSVLSFWEKLKNGSKNDRI